MKEYIIQMFNLTSNLFIKLLCLSISFIAISAQSSTVIFSDSTAPSKYIPGEINNDIADILLINPKNEQHISFNYFDTFNIQNNKLTIYNGASSFESVTNSESAAVIVIVSNSIAISNDVEIIGSPADVLFITNTGGNIICNDCSFKNINRLTIANATFSDSESIGSLNTTNGSVTINNLSAPGIQSLEVISKYINTTGTIDTNLTAHEHPEGGMIISENGPLIVGSGGVSLYSGNVSVNYKDLMLNTITKTSPLDINANINAATLGVFTANTINIPQNVRLSTISDAISTSSRRISTLSGALENKFYAPLEGIFLTTLKDSTADINVSGTLLTDNKLSIKSNRHINMTSQSRLISATTEFLARNTLTNKGLIQTTRFDASAQNSINNGSIAATEVMIHVDNNIFNSFGGNITANKITLKSTSGYVINGSRSDKINYNTSILPLSVDLSAVNWGISTNVSSTGVLSNHLAANILANEIYIEAPQIENINPYTKIKLTNENWDTGISINSSSSSQVSIQAETKIHLIASNYILNSSAIMGVNQHNGEMSINTPKLSNERYSLTTQLQSYNQVLYSDNASRQHDVINSGTVTEITTYSPPGRIFSFGQFRFSDGIENNIKAHFINEFSYFEIFQNAYFHETEIKTLGLSLGYNFSSTEARGIRQCNTYGVCSQNEQYVVHAEAETLFSIKGNLLGIDESIPSSDLSVDNADVLSAHIQILIEAYLETYNYRRTGSYVEGQYGYTQNESFSGDILTFTSIQCTPNSNTSGGGSGGCSQNVLTKSISELLDAATDDNEHEETGYTNAQIEAAAVSYVKTLPKVNTENSTLPYNSNDNQLVSVINDSSQDITIIYNEKYYSFFHGYGTPTNQPHTYRVQISVPLSSLEPHIQ